MPKEKKGKQPRKKQQQKYGVADERADSVFTSAPAAIQLSQSKDHHHHHHHPMEAPTAKLPDLATVHTQFFSTSGNSESGVFDVEKMNAKLRVLLFLS